MRIWTLALLAAVAVGDNAAALANGSSGITPAANAPGAGPAQPATPAGLDCIRNRLSAEERRAVAQLASEQGSRGDPRAQPLVRALDACAAELSWPQQKRDIAGIYALSAAGLAALRQELTGRGIDLAELDQAIESDQPLMAAAIAGQLGDGTVGEEFAQRHAAIIERMMGDRLQDEQLGVRIGSYIAFRVLALAMANRFAQER